MGVWAAALANLAAVAVSGVTSYALDQTPEFLGGAALPALIILPELSGESPGLEPSPFAAGAGRLAAQVAHVLLLAPVASGMGQRGALPRLVDLVDGYVEAMAADPLLGGALPVALRFQVRAGVVRYGGVDYHGATFLHTWVLNVG